MIIVTLSRLTLQLEHMRVSVGELAVSMELYSPANTSSGPYTVTKFSERESEGREREVPRGRKNLGRTSDQIQMSKRSLGRQPSDDSAAKLGYNRPPSDASLEPQIVDRPGTQESYMYRW
jgi:hypothetical protein